MLHAAPVERVIEPDAELAARSLPRYALYRQLYSTLRESFLSLDPAPE